MFKNKIIIYFLLILCCISLTGCQTTKQKSEPELEVTEGYTQLSSIPSMFNTKNNITFISLDGRIGYRGTFFSSDELYNSYHDSILQRMLFYGFTGLYEFNYVKKTWTKLVEEPLSVDVVGYKDEI